MSMQRQQSADSARGAAAHAAEHLATDERVQLVYLFGSAADPSRTAVRDVDLAVLTKPAVPFDELMRIRADLIAATGVEIDLVLLNHAPVVLAHEVADSGRCLYARDADVELEFVTRARSRYWDFKPFLDTQWQLAGERLHERGHERPHGSAD